MENEITIFYKTPRKFLSNNIKLSNEQLNKTRNIKNSKNSSPSLPKNSKMRNILSSIDTNSLPSLPSDRLNMNFVLSPPKHNYVNTNTNYNIIIPATNSHLFKYNNSSRSYKNLNQKNNKNNNDVNSDKKGLYSSKKKIEIQKNLKHTNNYLIFKNNGNFKIIKPLIKNYNNSTNNFFHKKDKSCCVPGNIFNGCYNNDNINNDNSNNYNIHNSFKKFQNSTGKKPKNKIYIKNNKIISFNNDTNNYRHYISKRFNYKYNRCILKIQSFFRGYSFRKKAINKIYNFNLGFITLRQSINDIFFNHKQRYFTYLISILRKLKKKRKVQINLTNTKKFRNLSPRNKYRSMTKNKNLLLLSVNSIVNFIHKTCYRKYFNKLLCKMIFLSLSDKNKKKIYFLKKIIVKINNKVLRKYFKIFKEQVLIKRIKEKIKAKKILNSTMPLEKSKQERSTNKKCIRIKHEKKNPFDSATKSSFFTNKSNRKKNLSEGSNVKLNIKKVIVDKPQRIFFTFINNGENLMARKLMNLVEKIERKNILNRNFVYWRKCTKK